MELINRKVYEFISRAHEGASFQTELRVFPMGGVSAVGMTQPPAVGAVWFFPHHGETGGGFGRYPLV